MRQDRMKIEDLPEKIQEQVREKLEGKPKKSKYHNKKIVIGNMIFDSQAEASYYCTLKMWQDKGIICNLQLQPRYLLQEAFDKNGKHYRKIEYIADFEYKQDGETRVIDVKGMKTDVFKLKQKLFEYKYPDLHLELVDGSNYEKI